MLEKRREAFLRMEVKEEMAGTSTASSASFEQMLVY